MDIINKILKMNLKGIVILYSMLGVASFVFSYVLLSLSKYNADDSLKDVHSIIYNLSILMFIFGIIFFIPVVSGIVMYAFKNKIRKNEKEISKKQEEIKSKLDLSLTPEDAKIMTTEKIKEISTSVKEIIEESKRNKQIISKIQLPVSEGKTMNIQLTPEVSVLVTVKSNEVVITKTNIVEPKVVDVKPEESKPKVEEKPKVVIPKPIPPTPTPVKLKEDRTLLVENKPIPKPTALIAEKPKDIKPEVKPEIKPVVKEDKQQKLSYKTIIPMVLKGRGKKRASDALAECKKLKNLKEWDKIFPMAKSRFNFPVESTVVIENNEKVKYVEWK